MNIILKKILETIVYHDLFDFPLTVQEIHLTMPIRADLPEVVSALDSNEAIEKIGKKDGFYFLKGREEITVLRRNRFDLAEKKYKLVRRFFRFARFAPFLRAVFICNTLSRSNARDNSDIDLFIVTAPGRIWLTRLFVTGLAALLRRRPTDKISKDRLCLSFFITSDSLALRSHSIDNDIYLPHWILDLYPVYDEAGISGNLFNENGWAREILPGLRKQLSSHRRNLTPKFMRTKAWVEGKIDRRGGVLEMWAREKQMMWMPKALKEHAAQKEGVVLSDSVLKLHAIDRRATIRDRFEAKLNIVISNNDRPFRSACTRLAGDGGPIQQVTVSAEMTKSHAGAV